MDAHQVIAANWLSGVAEPTIICTEQIKEQVNNHVQQSLIKGRLDLWIG